MEYRDKMITRERAYELIRPGDRLISGSSANDAKHFFSGLHEVAEQMRQIHILTLNTPYKHDYMTEEYKGFFEIESLFYSPPLRKAHGQGNISFVPNHVQMFYKRIKRNPPQVFVCAASMPDKHGFLSLSLSNLYDSIAFQNAERVILEINPHFPRTFGDVTVHVSEVDHLIEVDYKPPMISASKISEKDRKIGYMVSEMIPDRSCIQVGIGGIPDAVVDALKDKADLGIHSEMMTTGLANLVKSGVVTNKYKQLQRNKSVCCFAFGDEGFYEYLDDNPSIVFLDGSYTNDPRVISRNDQMMSINTTLEVDLMGQCCSESLGSFQLSGTGGQLEMSEGAQLSKDGKAFICLHSTAEVKNETGELVEVSKILPVIKPGSVVTLPRANVDYVVTEYGVANLRGTTMKERVEALVGIAHPKFREELLQEAKKLQYV